MCRKKINLAHLLDSFGTGGIENITVSLINNMNRDLFHHFVICFKEIGEFQERVHADNVTFICLNKRHGNDIRLFGRLWKVFTQNHIDIAYCNGWPTMMEGIICAKLAGVSVVIYAFRGKTYEDIQLKTEKKRRVIAQRLLVKMTDGVLTLVDTMKKDLCVTLNLPKEKVKIIHNGVDIRKFEDKASGVRSELGLMDNEFVVGAVGRLDRVKNYNNLIKAFQVLSTSCNNIKLVLVGDGDDRPRLQKTVSDLALEDKVLMTGRRDDVNRILSCFDVFIQPSWYEGLSNTILEAMAVGLPVIASDVGGNPDIVKEGINGLLFPPSDISKLAIVIEKLYSDKDLREKMSEENKKTIIARFSLQTMIKNYEEYYTDLYRKSGYNNQA